MSSVAAASPSPGLGRAHTSAEAPHARHALRNHALSEEARPVEMRPQRAHTSGAVGHGGHSSHRNSFMSVRSVKNIMTSSVSELIEKPIASAGGMSLDIVLAEPHVFLYGFDHDGQAERRSHPTTSAILRGKLRLVVAKNVKIRAVTVTLQGKARTEWPEGLPPLKVDLYEEDTLRTMNHTFFNAMHGAWSTAYGNMCRYRLKNAPENAPAPAAGRLNGDVLSLSLASARSLSARDIKKLSLQQVQARSFGKDDSPNVEATQAKGYKVFYPGTYEYTFEFPIDHHQLETITLPFGSVRWELACCIERAGAFKPNLHGTKEVSIVRVPDQLSLETVEPISIRRQWEDQLFYDIVISGKSFPIGGRIPIAFKLTPLAKVQLHKLKVYVTESTEYWTTSRRVTRKDPGRKILLFEKTAGKPVDPQYAGSDITFTAGGEPTDAERLEARSHARRRREREAARTHTAPAPLPEPVANMLGDLDLGLETYWGATELEMNVQLPTCRQIARDPNVRLHPDCSWRNATVYHWIKVVLRISRVDPEDPAGLRRRHFEISIDSPFTILNCLATQANTLLPQYTGRDTGAAAALPAADCGCPDAAASPAASVHGSVPGSVRGSEPDLAALPAQPQAAHVHGAQSPPARNSMAAHMLASMASASSPSSPSSPSPSSSSASVASQSREALTEQEAYESPRPIHLLRVPSYAPPAFDADDSPPLPPDVAADAVMTPPPNYDLIVGTPSVDGLADYFSRLANYDHRNDGAGAGAGADADADTHADADADLDSDSDGDHTPARIMSRGGRVNVPHPRTPGGLRNELSRSFDLERPVVPFNLHLAAGVRRRGQ